MQNPQRVFHAWVAKRHLKVHDSWQWSKEQHKNSQDRIWGLIRVAEQDVEAFAALSGTDGFFIDPPKWTAFPPFSV